jgi:hypothetical protein
MSVEALVLGAVDRNGRFARFLHRRNARAFCLSVRGSVRYAVRETLALDTLEGLRRTFPILDAKAGAVVIAEIEFREIAV